jgi:alpha-1,6-mannosyltransferase
MRTALEHLGRGYVAAGAERLLVIPGPVDAILETDLGDVVQVRAPRVGGGYRLIVEPWRVTDVLEQWRPTSVEWSDKLTLLPVAWWAGRNDVRSVLLSHERLGDMFAMRTGFDTTSKVSIGLLNRLLVRSFDTVVVTSRYAEGEFRTVADSAGCPVERVPLGVDLETFRPVVGRAGAGQELRLVHAGRLSREKSPHLAVATAVELHRRGVPVRLDVYGDGPHRDELEEIAAGSPVHFHGYVDGRATLRDRLAAADISLSVCPGETFGLAVLEALACGTPVVTADRVGPGSWSPTPVERGPHPKRAPWRMPSWVSRRVRRPGCAGRPASGPRPSRGSAPWTGCWPSTPATGPARSAPEAPPGIPTGGGPLPFE